VGGAGGGSGNGDGRGGGGGGSWDEAGAVAMGTSDLFRYYRTRGSLGASEADFANDMSWLWLGDDEDD